MNCTATRIPYKQTNAFSNILTAYVEQSAALRPFYEFDVDEKGIKAAIDNRKKIPVNRSLLVEELLKQYSKISISSKTKENIQKLSKENVFTICTAHQPALFTGPLYFIYKIIHAIKLASSLEATFPGFEFVPVFYMGSEDADLDELNHFYINGEKIIWPTTQKGAVGRMKAKDLEPLINRIEGELGINPFGKELVAVLRKCYTDSSTIQEATLQFLNSIFGAYGLVVLIPDNARLKLSMLSVFQKDIFEKEPSSIVEKTLGQLQGAGFKVQANPREINLFYLEDGSRERIVEDEEGFKVQHTSKKFTKAEMMAELETHPEKFSPNVILRGLFQETILPNIAFIGGGGELAYWLELKPMFHHYNVAFPVLIARNSFLLIDEKWKEKQDRLNLQDEDLFMNEHEIMKDFVVRKTNGYVQLDREKEELALYYENLRDKTAKIDKSLTQHISALEKKALNKLEAFEKKLVRAEKRKYEEEQKLVAQIKSNLFPGSGLQERVESFLPFYSRWGDEFIRCLCEQSLTLEQKFTVLHLV